MNQYYQQFMFRIKALDTLQWCFITFSLVAIWMYLVLIPNARQELKTLNQMAEQKPAIVKSTNTVELKTSNFYSTLPTSIQVKEILSSFYLEMDSKGLELSPMQFSLEESPDMHFAIYRFSAPIYGDYLGVMLAIKSLLAQHPTLAVKNIRLSRENIKEQAISADIDFAIYMTKD